MVKADGYELILGSSIDRQFGPVILFGAGGVLVEVFKDSALGLPPLNRTLARRLMERTTIFKALQGVRGRRALTWPPWRRCWCGSANSSPTCRRCRKSTSTRYWPGRSRSSPWTRGLLIWPNRGSPPASLAILPYPNQYTAPFRLTDGTEVTVRVIRPEDEPLIIEHHEQLSEHTIRRRFFGMVKHLSRERLIRLCHLDYNREMALVAVRENSNGPHILGVSRYSLDPETGGAEFAVVVSDPNQGHGLGRHLMERLIAVARDRGVKRLTGLVLCENQPMLELLQHFGFSTRPADDVTMVEAVLDL